MTFRGLNESELLGDPQEQGPFSHPNLNSGDINVAGVLAQLAKALEDLATSIYSPKAPQVEDAPSEADPKDGPEDASQDQSPGLGGSVGLQPGRLGCRRGARAGGSALGLCPAHPAFYAPPQPRCRSLPSLQRKYSSFLLDPRLLQGPGRGYFSRWREREEELMQDWNGEYRSRLAFLNYL